MVAVVVACLAAFQPRLAPGHVFLSADFESALPQGVDRAMLEPDGTGGHCLAIDVRPGSEPLGRTVTLPLPSAAMAGNAVNIEARVRAEGVSERPQPWNGIKVMMPHEALGARQWPQAALGVGSFDWQRVSFRVELPADARDCTLVLGLEQVSGKVWFDDVRVTLHRGPRPEPKPRPGPRYRGHDLSRLRGAMVSPDISEVDLLEFGREWNANLIRWQLVRPVSAVGNGTMAEYDAWLESSLARLDRMLPVCERAGLRVVIDLHSPPGGQPDFAGGYTPANQAFFTDRAAQERFVEIWRQIARRYRDSQAVWGYDLCNEPDDAGAGADCEDWYDLATRTAKAVREVDPVRTIIVEPNGWGSVSAFAAFRPIEVPNVVYSGHMYIPHEFTHQGVFSASEPVSYPGTIDEKRWDKEALVEALRPAREFQQKYNVHMYIGEFSAIRWAPDDSAHRYLRDLIDLFEQYGWDWTYHAFREWDGWSVEHGPDRAMRAPSSVPTSRERLLRGWFERNEKP